MLHTMPQGLHMDDLNIAEAARQTGKDRKTIYRLMKSGKLSFKVTADGRRVIDPAELGRVFPDAAARHGTGTAASDSETCPGTAKASHSLSEASHVAILQAQLDAALAREKVALEREKAAMERERQAVEREAWLRERLAESERERIELSHRLLPPGKDAPAEQAAAEEEDEAPRSWWRRLFG